MQKTLLTAILSFAISTFISAQTIAVFNNVPFYSMYHYLGAGETLPPEAFSEIPAGAIRMHAYERDVISRKLSETEIAAFGSEITMNINIIAACDNYDRIAGISLALVPKGNTTYTWDQADVKRIELGRIITPFMNKNKSPNSTPYSFKLDNLSKILKTPTLAATYDFWIEFRADGYSAAANTQVAGCADRTDVFRGNLEFVSTGSSPSAESFLLPLGYRETLNNYNATDVPGTTTKIVNFTLNQNVDNANLFLTISNHGANNNGEEYARREHFVYLDDQLVFQYKPGGKTCEPYRTYNTQGNGIYGSTPKTLRNWMSFNNWCPGDAIPNREISLGNLVAGNHTLKITVPDAVFSEGQGYFPVSMYIQDGKNGQVVCAAPTNFKIVNQVSNTLKLDWKENGNSTNWETLWGRKGIYTEATDFYQQNSDTPEAYRDNLNQYWFYEMYVKSKCTNDLSSEWVGPIFSSLIKLGTAEASSKSFSIYPNPVKDFVNIKTKDQIKSVLIYDMVGRKVTDVKSNSINISKFPKGNYQLVVDFTNGKTQTQQLIKE